MPESEGGSDTSDSSESDVVFERVKRGGEKESAVKRESSTMYMPVDESWRDGGRRGSANQGKREQLAPQLPRRGSPDHYERGYVERPDRPGKLRPIGEYEDSEREVARRMRRFEEKTSQRGRRPASSSGSDSEESERERNLHDEGSLRKGEAVECTARQSLSTAAVKRIGKEEDEPHVAALEVARRRRGGAYPRRRPVRWCPQWRVEPRR